jgi:prepilin-type N-terminal cleavage/methylation domain-containing protein
MRRGFSLIELVLVLMVLGIITAIAAPRFSGASDGYKLGAGQTQIQSTVNLWVDRAIRMSKQHTIHFDKAAEIIYLYEGEIGTPNTAVDSLDIGAQPYGIDLYRTDLVDSELVINGNGFFQTTGRVQFVKGDLGTTIEFGANKDEDSGIVGDVVGDVVDLVDLLLMLGVGG